MGAWWTWPENFDAPLVFYLTEEQQTRVFGLGDAFLRRMEEHSHTLIQLEPWFTAAGHTRVTVVGPPRARQWLLNMAWYVGHQDVPLQAEGLEMLRYVRSQPLTTEDLALASIVCPDTMLLSDPFSPDGAQASSRSELLAPGVPGSQFSHEE
ncbi:putative KHDC1-like protein [Perognathus longimembris pacificus]|uniref:putative KHDC1-like protein n=1 Tax=Perognathus longimembris pacificus TaxID=214514 RepID=UPI002018F8A6|nr:putative KHDC1-like protein [Perognathus longimembris pacificus]